MTLEKFDIDLTNLYGNDINLITEFLKIKDCWENIKITDETIIILEDNPYSLTDEYMDKRSVEFPKDKQIVLDAFYYLIKRSFHICQIEGVKAPTEKEYRRHADKIENCINNLISLLNDDKYKVYNNYLKNEKESLLHRINPKDNIQLPHSLELTKKRNDNLRENKTKRELFLYDQSLFENYELEKRLTKSARINLNPKKESKRYFTYLVTRTMNMLDLILPKNITIKTRIKISEQIYQIFENYCLEHGTIQESEAPNITDYILKKYKD